MAGAAGRRRSTRSPMPLGFVLFRLFDIWKPWPVRWADRAVTGGLGIMLDDLPGGGLRCWSVAAARRLAECSVFDPETLALAKPVLDACRARGWHARDRRILHRRPGCRGADRDRRLVRRRRARLCDLFERGQDRNCSGVPRATIAAHGAVSAETAAAMARGCARPRRRSISRSRSPASPGPAAAAPKSRSAWSISAWRGAAKRPEPNATIFPGDRAAVRDAALQMALGLARGRSPRLNKETTR